MKRFLRQPLEYVRNKMWDAMQRPDTDFLYNKYGIYGISAFLQQCWNPYLTKEILIKYGAHIHPDCWPIGPGITIHEAKEDYSNLHIDAFAHIGREVFLDLTERLQIGESCCVAMRAVLLTHLNVGDGYPNKPLTRLFPKMNKPTILRRGSQVGAGVIVACGVVIGEDSTINAGLLVDRDVPPRMAIANNRTKKDIRVPDRFFDTPLSETSE